MITSDAVCHVRKLIGLHSCKEIHERLLPMFPALSYAEVLEVEADVVTELQVLEVSRKEYLQSNRLRDYAAALVNFLEQEPGLDLDDRMRLGGEYNKVINSLV